MRSPSDGGLRAYEYQNAREIAPTHRIDASPLIERVIPWGKARNLGTNPLTSTFVPPVVHTISTVLPLRSTGLFL